ncbi:MAG: LicD family protein [Lachnospiraceae bacterium]|nr:LicD family protein [Lachnospiraceae bacterium]
MIEKTSTINMLDTPPSIKFLEAEEREGFFVSSMMKRYWAAQIKVLAEIDKVCKKHDIKWFADCGTLLGAVRHGGFIPWDDDLDICMLRHDWEKFFEVAKEELPGDYCVLSLRLEQEYELVIGRIVNSHAIDFGAEHMKEYFGCPYTVGIDIFPLDGLCEDEAAEEKRRTMAQDVQKAYELAGSGKLDTPECRRILANIEMQNHTTLHRRGNLLRELRLLTEKLYMMYPSDGAENVALMPFWVAARNHKYNRKLFEDVIMMPFEYAAIPVPARYNEVLQIEYGNYMSIHKGGGIHEYPVYKNQEDVLRKKNNGNPYRYTMTKEAIRDFHREKTKKEKCLEMTRTLMQAHEQVHTLVLSGNTELAGKILDGCQSLAISLGTHMENQMPGSVEMVHILEDYCEMVYVSSTSWDENSAARLNTAIEQVEETIETYFSSQKREVLFLPCKAEWWKSMEPVYEKYRALSDIEVKVMPLSYLDGDRLTGVNGGEHNDRTFFPESMNLVSVEEYDIAIHHPDVIVTQYPYDEWGLTMDVPGFFYSKNLILHTDRLVYVPCFDVDAPIDDDDKAAEAIKVMIEQPAVLYADQVLVSSEAMKKLYVDTLTDISGNREYWDCKIMVFDNSADRTRREIVENVSLPAEWQRKAGNRKIVLFGVNGAFLTEHGKDALDKLEEAMNQFKENSTDVVCLYAPSRDLDEIREINPDLWRSYLEFTDSIKDKKYVIYDNDHNAEQYINFVSGYYGTTGSLAHKCRNMGKPVMLMSMV